MISLELSPAVLRIATPGLVAAFILAGCGEDPLGIVRNDPPEPATGWHWENPLLFGNGLRAIWSSTESDVYAVGEGGIVLRYDGTDWSRIDLAVDNYLTAVWGSGPNDVFVAGSNGFIAHFDGTVWAHTPLDTGGQAFYQIEGTGPGDVWAGGSRGLVAHYDGTRWELVDPGTDDWFSNMSVVAPEDVWGAEAASVVHHFDGETWKAHGVPLAQVRGIKAFPDTVFVSGFIQSNNVQAAAVARSTNDGVSWQVIEIQAGVNLFNDLEGRSPRDLHAIGGDGRIHHFDGTTWTAGEEVGRPRLIYGLHLSPEGSTWIVGSGGLLARNDGAWTDFNPGDHLQTTIHGVWTFPDGSAVGVGSEGAVLRRTGNMWRELGSPTTRTLYDVWFDASGVGLAVGTAGTIVRIQGDVVTDESVDTFRTLNGVHGSSLSNVYAVGEDENLFRYDGAAWVRIDREGDDIDWNDVWVDASGKATVVGDPSGLAGAMIEIVGGVVEDVTVSASNHFESIWGLPTGERFVTVFGAHLLVHDGTEWEEIDPGLTNTTFSSVWASSPTEVYVLDYRSLFRFDGATFRSIHEGGRFETLHGIDADITVAGQNGMVFRHRE